VVLKKIWETCSQWGHLTLSVVTIPFLLLNYGFRRKATCNTFGASFPAALALKTYPFILS
jgi:hypothetical protein